MELKKPNIPAPRKAPVLTMAEKRQPRRNRTSGDGKVIKGAWIETLLE